jgi:hypothetical protein
MVDYKDVRQHLAYGTSDEAIRAYINLKDWMQQSPAQVPGLQQSMHDIYLSRCAEPEALKLCTMAFFATIAQSGTVQQSVMLDAVAQSAIANTPMLRTTGRGAFAVLMQSEAWQGELAQKSLPVLERALSSLVDEVPNEALNRLALIAQKTCAVPVGAVQAFAQLSRRDDPLLAYQVQRVLVHLGDEQKAQYQQAMRTNMRPARKIFSNMPKTHAPAKSPTRYMVDV